MNRIWQAGPLIFVSILTLMTSAAWAQEEADQTAWSELLDLVGSGKSGAPGSLLGRLPTAAELGPLGSLPPREFLDRFNAAPAPAQRAARAQLTARLRELSRRGVVKPEAVPALLGPEPAGVAGSEFFGVVPVPGASYQALLDYLEVVAGEVSAGSYQPGAEGRARLDRALRAQLAISSPESRVQYMDFDLVWANVQLDSACRAGGAGGSSGRWWLYDMLRESAGLSWLPGLSEDAAAAVRAEAGGLFLGAQDRARALPGSVAALTRWECGL